MSPSATLSAGDQAAAFAIRELLPTETAACRTFFNRLDPRDVRLRFASPHFRVEHFIPALAGWADGVALAAIEGPDAEAIIGAASLVPLGSDLAEIALIVRSDRKRRGVGRALIGAVAERAANIGVKEVTGLIDSENRPMLALALATGFRIVAWDSFFFEARRLPAIV